MWLINLMDYEMLKRDLRYDMFEPRCSPREIGEATVNGLEYVLRKSNSPVYLALEKERRRHGLGALKRLIILSPKKETVTIPMTSSASLLHLNKKPMFLGYEGSSTKFLDELIREIEVAVEKADALQPAS